jgi:hypothetical protein
MGCPGSQRDFSFRGRHDVRDGCHKEKRMSVQLSRRAALRAFALMSALPFAALAQRAQPAIEVYKSPTCGCCSDWIKHLERDGFSVQVRLVPDTGPHRARLGMPERLGACHTAVVEGYVVEGHVPAREIRRLLAERPSALGIAVPGMPIGSPGMDGLAYRGRVDPYEVLLVRKNGSTRVYASYG